MHMVKVTPEDQGPACLEIDAWKCSHIKSLLYFLHVISDYKRRTGLNLQCDLRDDNHRLEEATLRQYLQQLPGLRHLTLRLQGHFFVHVKELCPVLESLNLCQLELHIHTSLPVKC